MRTKMNANIIRTVGLALFFVLGAVCVNAQDFLSNQEALRKAIQSSDTSKIRKLIKLDEATKKRLKNEHNRNKSSEHAKKIKNHNKYIMLNTRITIAEGINVLPSFYAIEKGTSEIVDDKGNMITVRNDVDITTLKFLVENFELDINKEVLELEKFEDLLTFAIIEDNIPAVEYLNSLEGVDINDKTSEGIPKLFYVESLEMLQFLVEEQNANIFAKTNDGINLANYLLSELTDILEKEKTLELVYYLKKNGLGAFQSEVNPIANAIKSQDPALIQEEFVDIMKYYNLETLCQYLSQPDKEGKNLMTHLMENIDIYEDIDGNISVEINGKKHNILDYIIYLFGKYENQCKECGINLLPLNQHKDETGQPAIYKLEATESNIFILNTLIDNGLNLLETDKNNKIYLEYVSNILNSPKHVYAVLLSGKANIEDMNKFFKNVFDKTLEQIKETDAPSSNDFINFVRNGDINKVDEKGIPLIKKTLQEQDNAMSLYIAQHKDFDNTIQTDDNDYYPIDWAVYYSNDLVFETLAEKESEISYKTKQRAKKRMQKYAEDSQKQIANQKTKVLLSKNREIMLYIDNREKESDKEKESRQKMMSDVQKSFYKVKNDFPF